MELPWGTGLPSRGQRSSHICFDAAWPTHQHPLVSRASSLEPAREQWAGQAAHPGSLGASAVGLGKGRVLRLGVQLSLLTKGQHPAVKGAQIAHFPDLELHLHLLSRIESCPCPVFLPGVSSPQRGEASLQPGFLETSKFTFPLSECPRDDINREHNADGRAQRGDGGENNSCSQALCRDG